MNVRIAELIVAVRRRVRLAWCAKTLGDSLPVAFAALAVIALGAWLIGRPLPWWSLAAVPAVVVGGVSLWSGTRRWTDTEVARAVELRTGHDGTLVSALEFDDAADPWHVEVNRRAAAVVDDPLTRRCIPVRFDGRRTAAAALVAALVVALSVVVPVGAGSATADLLPEQEAEAAALEDLADVLEEAADEADDELEQASLDDLAAELRRLADEVRSVESPEEAALRLDERAQELRRQAGDDLLADKAAVQGLEQQLETSPLAPGGDASSQLDALAQRLDGLDAAARGELADRLDRLAESQRNGSPDVAEQLRRAAASLRAGDAAAAADALNAAAAGQRVAAADIAQRSVAETAANAATAAAGRLRNPGASSGDTGGEGDGQGDGEGNGNGQGDGEGQGDGQGAGSGDGAGQGAGDGDGSGGGGTPGGGASGQISGVSPTGGQSAGQGGQGSPGPGETGDASTLPSRAQVFDPAEGGASDRVDVNIGGGVGEGEFIGRSDAATRDGDAIVPLREVLPSYLESAATALEELDLPADLRTTVRNYFDHLAEN